MRRSEDVYGHRATSAGVTVRTHRAGSALESMYIGGSAQGTTATVWLVVASPLTHSWTRGRLRPPRADPATSLGLLPRLPSQQVPVTLDTIMEAQTAKSRKPKGGPMLIFWYTRSGVFFCGARKS